MNGAQLIAKIKADGIANFKRDMREAGKEVDNLGSKSAQAGNDMAAGMSKAARAGEMLVSRMAAVAAKVSTLLVTGFGAVTAGALDFTHAAIDQAAKVEQLQATFAALSHSTEIAAAKMRYLLDFAKTSVSQFADLAEAGTLLEASGLNMERILPTIANLSSAFGGTKEKVLELASAFGRIASGSFGESMRILRTFGIGAADFAKQGIKFDAGGEMIGSAQQVLTALEKIVQSKFGDMSKYVGNIFNTRLSNLQDAWNQMLANFGKAFLPVIGGMMQKLGEFASFLSDSGIIGNLGKTFASIGEGIFGKGDGLVRMASYLVATLEQLPSILSTSFNFLRRMFAAIGSDLADIFKFIFNMERMAVNFLLQAIVTIVNTVKGTIGQILQSLSNLPFIGKEAGYDLYRQGGHLQHKMQLPEMPGLGEMEGMFGKALRDFWDGNYFGDQMNDIRKRGDRIYDGFQKGQTATGANRAGLYSGDRPLPSSGSNPNSFFNASYSPMEENMKRTADNTGHIASSVDKIGDLKRYVVGGGPLAQIGTTPVELRGGRAHNYQIKVDAGNRKLNDALADMFADFLSQAQRQGMVPHH